MVVTHAKKIRTLITSWAPLEPGGVMGINMETILRFHVLEVIKGNIEPDTEIYVDYLSGIVTLQEYREAYASYGLVGVPCPDITAEEAKNTYIVQQDARDAPLRLRFEDNEQRYMLFMRYDSEVGRYVAWSGSYGICEVNDGDMVHLLGASGSGDHYINVSFYGPGIELAAGASGS